MNYQDAILFLDDPTETMVVDTVMYGGVAVVNAVAGTEQRLSFDDVWGEAFELAGVTEETIREAETRQPANVTDEFLKAIETDL